MSVMSERHKTLVDGAGLCSRPMWCDGLPAGFCDMPAYGEQTPEGRRRLELQGRSTFVPALACPGHGGPEKP